MLAYYRTGNARCGFKKGASAPNKGKSMSEEHKQIRRLGYQNIPEEIKRQTSEIISQANKGKTLSQKHLAMLKKINTGNTIANSTAAAPSHREKNLNRRGIVEYLLDTNIHPGRHKQSGKD